MGEMLTGANVPHDPFGEFFDLLKVCWSPNYCKFNDTFFEFPEEVGIPIGSPLGSLIAEVFMSKFESDLFSSGHALLSHIGYWFRYVDDILCLWTGPPDLLNGFLLFLNLMYASIKFTLEVGGSSINFLDLTVSARDGVHDFAIYRKDTSTDVLVHGSSFCPIAHRMAAFNSLVHRLIDIPLNQNAFNRELMIIKYLARVNEVRVDVDVMVRRKLTRRGLDSTTSLPRDSRRDKKRWIGLPFLGPFSLQLARTLSPSGFGLLFIIPLP